jgi:hypothetical protein
MAHFTQALKTILDRTFGGKIAALAVGAGMHGPEIGRLIREEAPVTAEKLEKLLTACDADTDRALLVHAAVRDFVGEKEYKARFTGTEPTESVLREDLGGPVFRAHFPIDPRAEQVLRYLVNNVQSNGDIEDALKLLGKFLELPSLEPVKPKLSSGGGSAFYDTIRHDTTPSQHAAQEHQEP